MKHGTLYTNRLSCFYDAMIRLAVIAGIAVFLTVHTQGVDLVSFRNDAFFRTPGDRLVRDSTGAPLVGTNYMAQLYYGAHAASASSLTPVMAPAASFRPGTHSLPGTWEGGDRRLTGFMSGEYVTLQVRVWDGMVASTYEDAAVLGFLGTQHGVSDPFAYFIPSLTEPSYAFYMEEFRGFTLVPEPSVALLAIIGIVGLYFARRRRE